MELREKILADIKSAMVSKDTVKLNTLRFLNAQIKNKEIDQRPTPLSADDVLSVVKKLVKQRKESIEQFNNAGRTDLASNEQAELQVLETYLPAQLSREQIEALVTEVIAALGAKTVKEMGSVMKETMARAGGAADGKLVSEVIKSKLA